MQDNSSSSLAPLPADLGDALRRTVLGTSSTPVFQTATAKPKATARQKKAALAARKAEERKAAEAARKEEAKLRRAEARLAQASADHRLLHEHKRCHVDCPHCAMARLDTLVF
jgi:predicted nucleotidyltransferase